VKTRDSVWIDFHKKNTCTYGPILPIVAAQNRRHETIVKV